MKELMLYRLGKKYHIDEKKIKTHNGEYDWDYKAPLEIDIT